MDSINETLALWRTPKLRVVRQDLVSQGDAPSRPESQAP